MAPAARPTLLPAVVCSVVGRGPTAAGRGEGGEFAAWTQNGRALIAIALDKPEVMKGVLRHNVALVLTRNNCML
ncbi:hypothetical protein CTheo_8252 [Ceratobasidium theobromae]|uniref:Uncharacterized protein n=1 Tax=Ceratobasidium theobromae TaxID=1582974 RepID=A0A5N5QA72_9AGAM|nr:hypothetical protein CTheo_8252 [Ceratobasidium theobromae]